MRVKQAEVLVPHLVDPERIVGAYAPNRIAAEALVVATPALAVVVTRYPFFQGPPGS
ncbi:MAG TPA: hypothetical protein VFP66_14895 [Candidatus Limnocylindrales bacterium]|nr:hypothetical protein [Candidatus Limnocylindrales bacterium]